MCKLRNKSNNLASKQQNFLTRTGWLLWRPGQSSVNPRRHGWWIWTRCDKVVTWLNFYVVIQEALWWQRGLSRWLRVLIGGGCAGVRLQRDNCPSGCETMNMFLPLQRTGIVLVLKKSRPYWRKVHLILQRVHKKEICKIKSEKPEEYPSSEKR